MRNGNLTVLKFETTDGAEKARHVIEDLSNQGLITLHDEAIVNWPADKKKNLGQPLLKNNPE
ncbi:hypothetical protein [Methanosarcina sp.]|uniref:hypothetical protein n=1 Tax=Methanosarcina sp. TaxID=2213 RepID=UPI003C746311